MKKKITERGYWDGLIEDIKVLRKENRRVNREIKSYWIAEFIRIEIVFIVVVILTIMLIK